MSHTVAPGALGERLQRAADAASAAGIDALLVTPSADLRYLVGYDAKPLERLTCLLVPARGEPALVVPRLELAAAEASGAGEVVKLVSHEETDDAYALVVGLLRDALAGDPAVLGVADRMWAEQVLRFRAAFPRAQQATAVNFIIVGSGPNGASPHHAVSDRVVEPGDVVVVDIGGTMPDGYCSDCTRTYVAGGTPDPEFARYYAVLLDAQTKACEFARPGVPAEAVDAAAREVIVAGGYGEQFIHRTGHGIGLEEHEDPYIVRGNDVVLEPGMCFSIEPGIYLPGRHGARIEDIVAVTDSGAERLDAVTRELLVLD